MKKLATIEKIVIEIYQPRDRNLPSFGRQMLANRGEGALAGILNYDLIISSSYHRLQLLNSFADNNLHASETCLRQAGARELMG